MKEVATGKFAVALLAVAVAGYALYVTATSLLAPPCATPIEYRIGEVDARFGVSTTELAAALQDAAAVWNEAAGKTVVAASTEGDIAVNLAYTDLQKAAELGQVIDAEQAAYDEQLARVEALRTEYGAAKRAYEARLAAFERSVDAYEAEVEKWNRQGGAPSGEYERLQQKQRTLDAEQEEVNEDAREVNALAAGINDAIDELNARARKLNAKVTTYNAKAGEDFDQGNYVEDAHGKRITVFEFTDRLELRRVLTHELGHALGLGHVENPDSIMYSFDIGTGLVLTDEDREALRQTCRLE